MMVGYASNSKGYKMWDADIGKIIISRDVRLDETFTTPRSGCCEDLSSSNFESEYKNNSDIKISSRAGIDHKEDKRLLIHPIHLIQMILCFNVALMKVDLLNNLSLEPQIRSVKSTTITRSLL